MPNAIFLSAGVPDPKQSPEFAKTADTVAINAAVSALVYVTLGRRLLVWGGHPAITPMIWVVAEDLGVEYGSWVKLYQSRYFEDEFPEENARFQNVIHVDATEGNREQSLRGMRERMFEENTFSAAVFIGGMDGIIEEYNLFRELNPDARILPVVSTGGAVLKLPPPEQELKSNLVDNLDYVSLFHRELGISVREERYASQEDQPKGEKDRYWPGPRPKKSSSDPTPNGDVPIADSLIAIALSLAPSIATVLAGDDFRAGAIAEAVKRIVAEVVGTDDPARARKKLRANPSAEAELKLKLARIVNDAERACREDEAKKRKDELKELRISIEDTKGARSTFSALGLANNLMAWGVPIVSFIVTLGFFGILAFLMTKTGKFEDDVAPLINIVIGALAAGFATVISFWLGSSQGSRIKDVTSIDMQERQSRETKEILDKLAQQTTRVLEKSAQQADAQNRAFQSTIATVVKEKSAIASTKSPEAIDRCVEIARKHDTNPELKGLPPDQVREIYRVRFWNVLNCDNLPAGVDLVVFDYAVDAGTAEAAKALQDVVGAKADGSIGPATIAATKAMMPRDAVKRLSEHRAKAGKGQSDRINAVEKAAMDMIAA